MALKRALQVDPTHRQALYNMCALTIELGRLAEAEACRKRYLELYPESEK